MGLLPDNWWYVDNWQQILFYTFLSNLIPIFIGRFDWIFNGNDMSGYDMLETLSRRYKVTVDTFKDRLNDYTYEIIVEGVLFVGALVSAVAMDTGFLKILHLIAETLGIKSENDLDFFQVGEDKTQEVVYTYDQYFIFNNVYVDAFLGVLYIFLFHHFVYLWSNLAFDYFYVAEARVLSCLVVASFVLLGAYFFLPFAMWYFQGQFYEGMDNVLDTFGLIHDKEDILTGMTVFRTLVNLVMLGVLGRGAYILNSDIFSVSIPSDTV